MVLLVSTWLLRGPNVQAAYLMGRAGRATAARAPPVVVGSCW